MKTWRPMNPWDKLINLQLLGLMPDSESSGWSWRPIPHQCCCSGKYRRRHLMAKVKNLLKSMKLMTFIYIYSFYPPISPSSPSSPFLDPWNWKKYRVVSFVSPGLSRWSADSSPSTRISAASKAPRRDGSKWRPGRRWRSSSAQGFWVNLLSSILMLVKIYENMFNSHEYMMFLLQQNILNSCWFNAFPKGSSLTLGAVPGHAEAKAMAERQ